MTNVFRICMVVLLTVLLVVGVGGCAPPPKERDKLLVYTSFYTMADFTQKIGGDKVTVVCLLPPGMEPHDWEPNPRDMSGLETADLFIYNGAGLEGWVEAVLDSLDQTLPTVKTSEHLTLLSLEEEEDGHEEDGHDHGDYDPHTWLSPRNAIAEMDAITTGLAKTDPANRSYYLNNYKEQATQLAALDHRIRSQLADLPQRELVVAHAAYGYFCKEYGLTQRAVRGYSPDGEPSPKKMAEIIDFVKEHQIGMIYYEENSPSAIVETIARETGADFRTLSPIEAVSLADQQAGVDYFTLMERNLTSIKEGQSQ